MPFARGPLIGSQVALAQKLHRVDVYQPDAPMVPDDGEYTQTYSRVGHEYAAIEPATPARLERFTQGGAIATASHVITMNYRDDITTRTRLYFNGRRFDVLGYASLLELGVDSAVVVQEIRV